MHTTVFTPAAYIIEDKKYIPFDYSKKEYDDYDTGYAVAIYANEDDNSYNYSPAEPMPEYKSVTPDMYSRDDFVTPPPTEEHKSGFSPSQQTTSNIQPVYPYKTSDTQQHAAIAGGWSFLTFFDCRILAVFQRIKNRG